MRRRRKRTAGRRIFAGLLLCSAVGLLLPARVTGILMNCLQVVVPLQDAAVRSADAIQGAAVDPRRSELSAERAGELIARADALQHTVASLRAQLADLEVSNRALTGIRDRGLSGKLIPAHVAAFDVLAWRDSQLIDAGSLRSVRRDAGVVSDHFAIHLGSADAVRSGQAVLSAEVFVGTIELVGTHTSRVRLVSDPQTRMPVQIAREPLGPLEGQFWLVGAGRRRARIEDVDHRYVREGGIEVGDSVLTVNRDERLPVSMVIGTVTSIAPKRDNRLLYVLEVKPALDPDRLRRVYVVDPR